MAPTKKGAPASSSKRVPGANKTHDGRPTRAEKSAANKARYAVEGKQVRRAAHQLIVDTREDVKRGIGRPRDPEFVLTGDICADLFALIATGTSLREIAKLENMPPLVQMLRWLSDAEHNFSLLYTRARQCLVPLYEEDIQAIGLSSNVGKIVTQRQMLTKDGDVVDTEEVRTADNVERSKLAVATLQWTLGHLKPKKHGRNPDLDATKPNEQLEGLFNALKSGPAR